MAKKTAVGRFQSKIVDKEVLRQLESILTGIEDPRAQGRVRNLLLRIEEPVLRELAGLITEMRGVQRQLAQFREGVIPISEAVTRREFYSWYKTFVREDIRPGSYLYRPIEELLETYNRYVERIGAGERLGPGTSLFELRRAAKSLTSELYKKRMEWPSWEQFFQKRAELTTALYEMAQRHSAVRGLFEYVGLRFSPLTAGDVPPGVPEWAVERALERGEFTGYFRFGGLRESWRRRFLSELFYYDYPSYQGFLRGLESYSPGAAQAWSGEPVDLVNIEGRLAYPRRMTYYRGKMEYGGMLPAEARDLWSETAASAEMGLPPLKLQSTQELRSLVREERRGYHLRQAVRELEDLEYFSREKALQRRSSLLDRLAARVALERGELPEAVVQEYIGRELIERKTGARWRIAGAEGQRVFLEQVFEDPSALRFKWPFATLSDFVENVLLKPAPLAEIVESTVDAGALTREARRSADRRVVDALLGLTEAGELRYTPARLKGVELEVLAPVARAFESMPVYRYLLSGSPYAEDIVQSLQERFVSFAQEWAARTGFTEVTEEARRRFVQDWLKAARGYLPELLAEQAAGLTGTPFGKLEYALKRIADALPDFDFASVEDLATLRAKVPASILSMPEWRVLEQLANLNFEELKDLARYISGAAQAPLSLHRPVYIKGEETAEHLLDRIVGGVSAEEAALARLSPEKQESLVGSVVRRYGEYVAEREKLAAAIEAGREVKTPRLADLIHEFEGTKFPERFSTVEAIQNIAYALQRDPSLGEVRTAEGYLVRPERIREDLGISEWRVVEGPEAGRVLYFGTRGGRTAVRAADLPSLFTWGGYDEAAQLLDLPFATRLSAPTSYFRGRAQGILESVERALALQEGQRVAVFDIEATTLPELAAGAKRPELFGLTELGAREYLVKEGRLVPTGRFFRTFIRPSRAVESFAQELVSRRAAGGVLSRFEQEFLENIERIGLERLKRGVVNQDRALRRLADFLLSADVVLGQNVTGFDLPLLERMGFPVAKPVIDVQALAAYAGAPSTRLEALVERYAPEAATAYKRAAHRVMGDIQATAEVFNRLARQISPFERMRIGDYLVLHTAPKEIQEAVGFRGTYRVLNYIREANALELLRLDTGRTAVLAAQTRADLEHMLYTYFYHLGRGEEAARMGREIDLRYAQDRAARMVRRSLTDLASARRYAETFRALEMYAEAARIPSVADISLLRPDIYERLPEEYREPILALERDARASALLKYRQAYRWFKEEFEPVHLPLIDELEAAVEAGTLSQERAGRLYAAYTARLARKFPYPTIERAADIFEQRIEVSLLPGKTAALRVGVRQWAEQSVRRAVRDYLKAAGIRLGTEEAAAAELGFIRGTMLPALQRAGISVAVSADADATRLVQEISAALAEREAPLLAYEDVLAPRTAPEFLQAAAEAREGIMGRIARLAGRETLTGAVEEALPAEPPGEALTERLKKLGYERAAAAERYSLWRQWGGESALEWIRGIMRGKTARTVIPAALSLSALYFGFQLMRNDPLDLGVATPHVQPFSYNRWGMQADMRLYNPPAPVAFDVRVAATDRQNVRHEDVVGQLSEGVRRATGVPMQFNLAIKDNTNNLSLDWWQRNIADAISQ
ncbi:MAG: hypothetical protein AB1330_01245 [Bacillota bacterium]